MAPPGHPALSFWGPSIISCVTPQSALFGRVLSCYAHRDGLSKAQEQLLTEWNIFLERESYKRWRDFFGPCQ